jgi:hypothetical protein
VHEDDDVVTRIMAGAVKIRAPSPLFGFGPRGWKARPDVEAVDDLEHVFDY